MPHIELGFAASAVIVVLLVLVATAAAIFSYRYTLPPVSPARRLTLTVLRAAGLSLVLTLLFEPLLRLLTTTHEPPVLAVLVDNSKSMTIVDGTGDRSEALRSLMEGSLERLAGQGSTRYYTFGVGAMYQEHLDTLALDEDGTDITGALRAVEEDRRQQNIQAVILLTDGIYTLGQNPLYEAERLGIPVFTVGIGDSAEQRDVLISRLATNDLVYAETEVPVDVTVKSTGYAGARVEVTLTDGVQQLARSALTLGEGTREHSVRLTYTPQGEGTKRYTVTVSPLDGELTTANNRRSFFARVRKSKLRVLMVAGSPSPDLAITRYTLAEEKHIDVRSFTQRLPDGFYEGALTQAVVDSTDCIVLVAFPTAATAATTLELLRDAVARNATPLLFIAGRNVDEQRLRALIGALPFTYGQTRSTVEEYVFFQPAIAQQQHPILQETVDAWSRMPPIFRTQTAFLAKPEATTIGLARRQAVVTGEPLVLLRNVNRQKSMAILGYGIWRWRLMAQGNADTERVFSTFMANAVRWLTTREDWKRVSVATTREAYTEGEQVELTAQVYDESGNPVDNAQVKVTARRGDREIETLLRPIGSGRYEGSLAGTEAGDYSYRATASLNDQPLGQDAGRFTVGELNLEFQDTRMNVQLLRQIAWRTGGEFATPATLASLQPLLQQIPTFTPREVERSTELELWNWQYTLALIVLVFAAEWFLRKRSGML